jgi:hypothetical protein
MIVKEEKLEISKERKMMLATNSTKRERELDEAGLNRVISTKLRQLRANRHRRARHLT